MKNTLRIFPLLSVSLVVLASCSSSKESMVQRKADIQSSKEAAISCFVQMNDGSIRYFSSLKLVTGLFMTPHLLGDGKIKIKADAIKAYQNKDHYAISQSAIASGRRSYVAVESLPGFAVRILKGEINVYSKQYYNGSAAVDEFFLQSGESGPIVAFSTELMKEMTRENPAALDLFSNKKYLSAVSKKSLANHSANITTPLMTKNK